MNIISKTRKQKQSEYLQRYSDIPKDYKDRLNWMIDKYNLSSKQMTQIIDRKRNLESSLNYSSFKIVLYEDPEGAKRPRFRLITKKNYPVMALQNSSFIHVYSPNAADDNNYMHRLVNDELIQLTKYIQLPCATIVNGFFKTPSYFNTTDTFLAEIGMHRPYLKPDVDNIEKKYFDMLNGNIWLDDSLVTTGIVNKFYSILPRVEIYISYINYATNKYQYNNLINRKGYNDNYPIQYI